MAKTQSEQKALPPLEVGRAYLATDFQYFEYSHVLANGKQSILRLHLKNGTSIDLPVTDDQLKQLARVLTEAFGQAVIDHLRSLGWI